MIGVGESRILLRNEWYFGHKQMGFVKITLILKYIQKKLDFFGILWYNKKVLNRKKYGNHEKFESSKE